jgi:hypothetical protein
MFDTLQYNTKICECGIPLNFSLIRPLRENLAELRTVQVNNFLVTFTTRSSHSIRVGDTIEIVSGGNLSSVFIGKHKITEIGSSIGGLGNNNLFSFVLRVPDIISSDVNGYAYSIPNIDNSGRYIIQFSKELSVPDNAEIEISPSVYEIQGSSNFSPIATVKIKSIFTTSSKVIIKLSISNIFGRVLYTEYKQIICSRFLDKPCEIVSLRPITPSYIFLNRKNNWTYKHNGFLIAQFIPDHNDEHKNISIRLNRPNQAILPSNTNFDRLVLKIDPLLAQTKNVTRDQIKTSILDNPISSSLQKNISVDDKLDVVIIQSSGLNIEQLKKVVVLEQITENITTKILVEDIGSVSMYIPEPHPVPSIMFLTWSNTEQKNYFLGQLLFDYSIFNNQEIKVYFTEPGNEIPNEIDYTISPFVTTENLGYYDYSG